MQPKKITIGVTAAETFLILGEFPARLRDDGWDVTLISSPGKALTELEHQGFDTRPIRMARNPSLFNDIKALFKAISVLSSRRDSVVIAGTPKASLLLLAAASILRIKIRVYDVKGLRYESESGAKRAVLKAFERLSMAMATHVLAISSSIKETILEDRLSTPAKVTLLGSGADHGVNTQRFRNSMTKEEILGLRNGLRIPDHHTVVGYVGRINRDKGLAELADCAKTIAESLDNITFVIVGSNDADDFRPFTDPLPNVVRIEWVDDTRPYFEIFDIFCLPTYREGLPNVNLQASAMQVPVITTNATGAIDSVIDGETGLIVPVGSSAELTKAVMRLHNNTALARKLGQNGRRWVKKNFEADLVQTRRIAWLDSLSRQ